MGLTRPFLGEFWGSHREHFSEPDWVGAQPKNSIIRGHVVVEAVVGLKTC